MNAADAINDLRVPPANRLEKLAGARAGQYSIRVNDQWRICFTWSASGAGNLEMVDYQ
ncbi:type II toxin-antitoxin system RelE/ParE family toxin [Mycobacterium sp.]|uniref:type II toxin-antitoxin system RelE/ParE family toxin n=1 Tax=Mycobacterium sp. TaxID=1785 RepID=UPI00333F9A32